MILLFGNSFGAQATAYQLTGGQSTLVPLLIGSQMTGDVLHNTGLGYAAGDGDGRDHGRRRSCCLPVPAAPRGALAPMTRDGTNRLGQGIDAMQGDPLDLPHRPRRRARRFVWLVFIIGASSTSSCR